MAVTSLLGRADAARAQHGIMCVGTAGIVRLLLHKSKGLQLKSTIWTKWTQSDSPGWVAAAEVP
jgi:hypothetical protein